MTLATSDLIEKPKSLTVAVYGCAGNFGRTLARSLHRRHRVLAIDPRLFESIPKDIEHHQIDLRRKQCREVFRSGQIDAVIHLGELHHPASKESEESAFTRNLENLAVLLKYCDTYNVCKLILLSSADVYGARARNPQYFTEDAPLLASGLFALRDMDMMAQSFFWKRPDIETVILRPAHIAGNVNSALASILKKPVVPLLLGFDPIMQLVHELDIVQAVLLSLSQGVRGIFNIAGPPPLPLSRIARSLGREIVRLPHSLARPLASQLQRINGGPLRASLIGYAKYVCMVDDTNIRRALGFEPHYGREDTIRALENWL